jgi:adenosylhomocysteine nucleosidase
METLLLIAANPMEFSGLVPRLPAPQPMRLPLDYAIRIDAGDRCWLLAANGPGPRLAAAAVETAMAGTRVNAVISTGFCGGLDPSLEAGDVFVADAVLFGSAPSAPASKPACSLRHSGGVIVCGDRVIQTVEEKQAVRRQTGASAVDMESGAVQAQARLAGVPFYCVRSVTDTAGESFFLDFNSARDQEGRFIHSRILKAALRRPLRGVPELFRLTRRARLAADALGGFLTACEF